MNSAQKRHLLCWGLLVVGVSVTVPQAGDVPKQPTITEARHAAAIKQFNLIWQYYQQSRVQSFDVYLLVSTAPGRRAKGSARSGKNRLPHSRSTWIGCENWRR